MIVKKTKRLLAFIGAVLILAPMALAYAAEDGSHSTYTYNYDYWTDIRESPDAYRVATVVRSSDLALGGKAMSAPQSLFVLQNYGEEQADNRVFIADRGNNRILELTRKDEGFVCSRIIDHAVVPEELREEFLKTTDLMLDENGYRYRDEAGNLYLKPAANSSAEIGAMILTPEGITSFNGPNDMAVAFMEDEEGNRTEYMWVADTSNNRVLKIDISKDEPVYVSQFVKPVDATFDQNQSFLPNKIVVDSSGRVFVQATNVNKGLVKFEANGVFTGFIGANQVVYNLWDYIWKTFFTTKEQRSQQASFVPTEYQNVYMDKSGFIYATNISFSEYDLLYDNAKPIRRLNAVGTDILIKNDRYPPIGDLDWVEQSTDHGPSKFYDVTVLENDMYVAIDRTRGRLFGYDPQGIMLWAFGMSGVSSDGSFNKAVSIEHMGYDLLVLDELDCSVTVFTPTEYGNLIYKASEEYLDGDYDGSAATWQEVMKYNPNYTLAIIGIGRSEMREAADLATTQERSAKYSDAMEHFKNAHDRENYGRAFRYYRKEWVEQNIGWIVLVLAVLLLIPVIKRTIEKIKWEVAAYESRQVRK